MENEAGRKFNKDLAELEHLQNLEIEADQSLVRNDNSTAYRCLRSMLASIYSLLTPEERLYSKTLLNKYVVESDKSGIVLDLRFFIGEMLIRKKLHLNEQVDMASSADK